jgi:hypothetical protein
MNDETIRIVVICDDEADLAALGELEGLEREEGAVQAESAVLSAVLLVGAIFAAAKLVMRVIDEYRGGVQIELNVQPPVIRRNQALPYGAYVIVAADNTVKIETHDQPGDAIERMTTDILKLPVGAAVSAVEATIKAAVPDAPTQTPALKVIASPT